MLTCLRQRAHDRPHRLDPRRIVDNGEPFFEFAVHIPWRSVLNVPKPGTSDAGGKFGSRQHAHMRRIAQPLDGVVQAEFDRILRGNNVDDDGDAAGTQHPEHFVDRPLWRGEVMDRETRDDGVERSVVERQFLRVACF